MISLSKGCKNIEKLTMLIKTNQIQFYSFSFEKFISLRPRTVLCSSSGGKTDTICQEDVDKCKTSWLVVQLSYKTCVTGFINSPAIICGGKLVQAIVNNDFRFLSLSSSFSLSLSTLIAYDPFRGYSGSCFSPYFGISILFYFHIYIFLQKKNWVFSLIFMASVLSLE